MQSNNPVFNRADGFNGRRTASGMTIPAYDAAGAYSGYADGTGSGPVVTRTDSGRMTIDTVVQKTAITLGVVVVAALVTWLLTPDLTPDQFGNVQGVQTLQTLAMLGAFAGFGLSLVNSFKRVISPALVLAYALFEGIFIGAFSKTIDTYFGDGDHGIVVGAVMGTVAAVAGTLAAYKFFNIKVGDRFRKFTVAAMFGFVAVALLDMVMGLFSSSFGFNGFGPLGLVSSLVGLGIAVLMLIMDFDYVERGIAAGLPERESWRAAFGLTVTIIWLYIELLRILAILRGD
jgi:uncharacterized YccA/Bax inhibitor family protein